MARMAIAPEDRPKVKAECLRLLATLHLDIRKARLISRFVDSYLNLNAQENREFYQELDRITRDRSKKERVMAYVTSWERQGIRKGIRKGVVKGRREGTKAVVVRQLTLKFGALDTRIKKRISRLSLPRLQRLSDALLTLSSIAQLESWLSSKPTALGRSKS